eukprot:15437900-Alexandrium_andersonii.AAC.1
MHTAHLFLGCTHTHFKRQCLAHPLEPPRAVGWPMDACNLPTSRGARTRSHLCCAVTSVPTFGPPGGQGPRND